MFKSDRWWLRELAARERAWAAERAELVATVCRLAGNRAPGDDLPEPQPEPPDDGDFDGINPDLL